MKTHQAKIGEPKTRSYLVTWSCDFDAASPAEAIQQAVATLQDPGNWASIFRAEDHESGDTWDYEMANPEKPYLLYHNDTEPVTQAEDDPNGQ